MRIALIGQAAFAEEVLNGLRERGHECLAVYCPPDAGGREDPVKTRAAQLGIPVRQHRSLKGPEVAREFAELQADLGVLAYVTQIVPESVFQAPRLGSICFHPSLLPRYRGGSAINWQIMRGEKQGGVTVFWVDAGIDTGPVLLQKTAAIAPDDTAGTFYYKTVFPIGVATVLESVDLIATGKAPRTPQDETKASYDPLCRDEHVAIDWSRPVADVYNLIRGADPQPGAYTTWKGEKLRIYDAQLVRGGTHRPAVVEDVSASGMRIGAGDGAILAARVRFGTAKVHASEFAAANAVQAGTSLG